MGIIKFDPNGTSKKEVKATLEDKIEQFLEVFDNAYEKYSLTRDRYEGILDSALRLAKSLKEYPDIEFEIAGDFIGGLDEEGVAIVLVGKDSKKVEYRMTALPSFLIENSNQGYIDLEEMNDPDGDYDDYDEDDDEYDEEEEGRTDYLVVANKIDNGKAYVMTDNGWEECKGQGIVWFSEKQMKILEKGDSESELLEAKVMAEGPITDAAYNRFKKKNEALIKLHDELDGVLDFWMTESGEVFLTSDQMNLFGTAIGYHDGKYEVYQYLELGFIQSIRLNSESSANKNIRAEDYVLKVAELSFDEAVDYCRKVFDKYIQAERLAISIPLSSKRSVFFRMHKGDIRKMILDALDQEKDLDADEAERCKNIKRFVRKI